MATPLASFSGLATGLDTATLIEELVKIERRPITQIQTKQSDLSRVSGRLGTIRTQLSAVKTAAQALTRESGILTSQASSSDEDRATVSSTGTTPLGKYALSVTALATAERTYSDPFSSKTTALNDASLLGAGFSGGTLSLTVGGAAAVDITIAADDTLESLAAKINGSSANVSAGILFDGTNYRLQVTGDETGTAQGIAFSETGTGLDMGFTDPANEVVAAGDAQFSLDGFAMSRASNSFSDAISGMTIELKDVTVSDISISVTRDAGDVGTKLKAFIEAYNQVTKSINSEFVFTGQARVGDSLSGDSTLRGLQSQLRSLSGAIISERSAPYNTFRSIGISTNSDGTLALDQTKLDAALADNFSAVTDLLADDPTINYDGFMTRFVDLVEQYTQSGDGILASRIDSIGRQVRDLDQSIERMDRRVTDFEETLRRQFTSLEVLVSGLTSQQASLTALTGGNTAQTRR